ncbi:hypothetical protein E0W68_10600 [Flavobacterium salilacus subsp. salilacus]|uniref:hypothetical protein n=1 Tax=Flavobacterium TaxID=237 RepID=UPI0010752EC8|nr:MULTISPECIES: hypothetical protein [Flavobacterium]KAF2518178.1 hypothetical protein E0W68_10600 [Flavobacterium salilacus subsp. salilacus]MBE1615511.1 hypothetical protein [Flavobacterium sp. SaA2.13]
MYLQNLNLEEIDYNAFKKNILETYEKEEVLKEDEIEKLLADNYLMAADAVSPLYYKKSATMIADRANNFSASLAGGNIWRRVLAFLCKVLNAASSAEEILEKIIEFLSRFLPGGIVLEKVAKAILRFFLKWGYGKLCPVN